MFNIITDIYSLYSERITAVFLEKINITIKKYFPQIEKMGNIV